MKERPLLTAGLYIATGTAASIAAGLIFFGLRIFDANSPLFQIIVYGLAGSSAFILFRMQRYRDAVFFLLIIFILDLFIFNFKFPLNRTLYFLTAVAGAYIFIRYFYHQCSAVRYARPILLGGIYAILSVVVVIIVSLVYNKGEGGLFPFINMPIGFLVGLGLGGGFELADHLAAKILRDGCC